MGRTDENKEINGRSNLISVHKNIFKNKKNVQNHLVVFQIISGLEYAEYGPDILT